MVSTFLVDLVIKLVAAYSPAQTIQLRFVQLQILYHNFNRKRKDIPAANRIKSDGPPGGNRIPIMFGS